MFILGVIFYSIILISISTAYAFDNMITNMTKWRYANIANGIIGGS